MYITRGYLSTQVYIKTIIIYYNDTHTKQMSFALEIIINMYIYM